jgi:heterodisulfide reductase subunit C
MAVGIDSVTKVHQAARDRDFAALIRERSGQPIEACFHCHKCTSGCLLSDDMAYGPDQILRLVELGEDDCLLCSHDIWLCAGCQTCGARCPNDIDIAAVIDVLRQVAVERHARLADPDSFKFHHLFLETVRRLGRMHEATLLIGFKLWTGHLMSDMNSGIPMVLKGKVPLLPHATSGQRRVAKLFGEERSSEGGGTSEGSP